MLYSFRVRTSLPRTILILSLFKSLTPSPSWSRRRFFYRITYPVTYRAFSDIIPFRCLFFWLGNRNAS